MDMRSPRQSSSQNSRLNEPFSLIVLASTCMSAGQGGAKPNANHSQPDRRASQRAYSRDFGATTSEITPGRVPKNTSSFLAVLNLPLSLVPVIRASQACQPLLQSSAWLVCPQTTMQARFRSMVQEHSSSARWSVQVPVCRHQFSALGEDEAAVGLQRRHAMSAFGERCGRFARSRQSRLPRQLRRLGSRRGRDGSAQRRPHLPICFDL